MFDPNKEKERLNLAANGNKITIPGITSPFENIQQQGSLGSIQNNINDIADQRYLQNNNIENQNTIGILNQNNLIKQNKEKKVQFSYGIKPLEIGSGLGTSLNFNSQTDDQSNSMF